MDICVIGAGSMGGLYGGRLALTGHAVSFIDLWAEHVDAINRDGLRLDGIQGDHLVRAVAATGPAAVPKADLALIFVDTNATADAARTAQAVLKPDGAALTLQNGIGNVEALVSVLGRERVLAGLSYHSAALQGPGHDTHTHAGPTWIGELDGSRTPRLAALEKALAAAGFDTIVVDDVIAHVWTKFVLNSGINALCAITGLRLGEVARLPATHAFQGRLVDEILAVVAAKGVRLTDPDPKRTILDHTWSKYNKPSMLQHMEAGKRTEIDALNGAVVREGRALGIPTPFNEALTLLIKGRELHMRQTLRGPAPDYAVLEQEAKATPRPAH